MTDNWQVVFREPGQVAVHRHDMRPLQPGEVRVQTHCSLISAGTECANLRGEQWEDARGDRQLAYPVWPGYSNAGVVVERAQDVRAFGVGDRVASGAHHAAYVVLRPAQRGVWRIPAGVDFEEAAFCNLASTALNGVRLGRPGLGDTVAIVGMGLLGHLACQGLRQSCVRTLVAVDIDDFRLELAERVSGASHALNPACEDAGAAIRQVTDGRGADVVYEVTGATSTYDLVFDLAGRHGTVIALGHPRSAASVAMNRFFVKGLTLLSSMAGGRTAGPGRPDRWDREAVGRLFLELAQEGALNVKDLITHRFAYDKAAEAYATAMGDRGPALGIVLKWQQPE